MGRRKGWRLFTFILVYMDVYVQLLVEIVCPNYYKERFTMGKVLSMCL